MSEETEEALAEAALLGLAIFWGAIAALYIFGEIRRL